MPPWAPGYDPSGTFVVLPNDAMGPPAPGFFYAQDTGSAPGVYTAPGATSPFVADWLSAQPSSYETGRGMAMLPASLQPPGGLDWTTIGLVGAGVVGLALLLRR